MDIIERTDLLPGECIVLPGLIAVSTRASPEQRRELLEAAGFTEAAPPIRPSRFAAWRTLDAGVGLAAVAAGLCACCAEAYVVLGSVPLA